MAFSMLSEMYFGDDLVEFKKTLLFDGYAVVTHGYLLLRWGMSTE